MTKLYPFLALTLIALVACNTQQVTKPYQVPSAKSQKIVSKTLTPPASPPKSLAEQTLESILEDQTTLLQKIIENPEAYSQPEQDHQLDKLLKRYEVFLSDNPDHVHAYILYGKLLREIGLTSPS